MDMIKALASAMGAGFAGFIGHLLAHDFVQLAPKFSRSIIQYSTRILSETDRVRYTEEWLADLEERSGVFSKFSHAIGCLLCVIRIRSQSRAKPSVVVRFQAGNLGTLDLDYATSMLVIDAIGYGITLNKYPWLRNPLVEKAFRIRARHRLRKNGIPDCAKALQLIKLIERCPNSLRDLQVSIDGVLIE
jgi:hypothetical protein